MTTTDNSADVLAPSQAAREAAEFDADQQRRRAELVKRISVFCDHINLPGEDGDAAYDLLREAAARIGSDRLRFERNIRTESADDALLRDELAALLDEASTWHWNPGVFENVREPLFYDRDDLWQRIDFLRSALSPATPTTGDAGDGLRDKLANWRRNLAITRGDPVAGYFLHGPALDFVIEQLDGFLTPTPSQGDGK